MPKQEERRGGLCGDKNLSTTTTRPKSCLFGYLFLDDDDDDDDDDDKELKQAKMAPKPNYFSAQILCTRRRQWPAAIPPNDDAS